MNDLITIVVPIYNVSKYLVECIESIIYQTYNNIEIILVDDGSYDGSSDICDKFEKKDSRIRVIHKTNGGLSDARNVGIKNAKGKYICFIDSDDIISKYYLEKLYNAIYESQADISVGNFTNFKDTKEINDIECKKALLEINNGKESIKKIYNKKTYLKMTVAWNKLYKTELFSNILYDKGKIHEDESTTYKILYKANKVVIISDIIYYYRYVPNSITNQKISIKKLDAIEALENRLIFFADRNEIELYNLTLIRYASTNLRLYLNFKKNLENSECIQEKLLGNFKKVYRKCLSLKECSLIDKIKFIIDRKSVV